MTKRQRSIVKRNLLIQVAKLEQEYWRLSVIVFPYGNFTYVDWVHLYHGKLGRIKMLRDRKKHFKTVIKRLKEVLHG